MSNKDFDATTETLSEEVVTAAGELRLKSKTLADARLDEASAHRAHVAAVNALNAARKALGDHLDKLG